LHKIILLSANIIVKIDQFGTQQFYICGYRWYGTTEGRYGVKLGVK